MKVLDKRVELSDSFALSEDSTILPSDESYEDGNPLSESGLTFLPDDCVESMESSFIVGNDGTSRGLQSSNSGVTQRNLTSHVTPRGTRYHTTATNVRCGTKEYVVGLYGWRRRCLYAIVFILLVAVIINLALTLFILRVLDFSATGMGGLQIVKEGIVANGNVHIMDTLVAAQISSRPHTPIRIFAAHNLSLAATNTQGQITNSITIDSDDLLCTSDRFLIRGSDGEVLFSASKEEVLVGAPQLTVTGEGGASLSGSLQTGHVTAPVGESLLLESTTRNLEVVAPQGIALESRAGSINAHCLLDFTLKSTAGMIKLDTPKIFVLGLPTSTIQRKDPNQVRPDVYQVCVCSGGKIFLASPGGVCAADHEFCK